MKYAANENRPAEKNSGKILLAVGFALCLAAFIMAFVPLVMFLVPGGTDGASSPLVTSGIYVNAFAVAASFTGIVLTAAAKPKSGALARFSLFFGAIAFLVALAAFIVCLLFGAVIPLHSMD